MAIWLRWSLAVGFVVSVLTLARPAPLGAQGTPVAPATPCVPQPSVEATPIAEDGSFPMPACGTVVIDAVVNNGPVSPEFQVGYEITIDTGGSAIVAIKHEGTPVPEVQIVNLGQDGLQQLLGQLQQIGFFGIGPQATPGPETPIMVGGPTNSLSVWLGTETWQVSETGLPAEQVEILNQAQQAIVDAVGVEVP